VRKPCSPFQFRLAISAFSNAALPAAVSTFGSGGSKTILSAIGASRVVIRGEEMTEHDQSFYDTMFALKRALVFLASEARTERELRQDMTVRALKAEARLRNTQIERDFWKALTRRDRLVQQKYRERKRAA
jgi:hypothetical protein